MSTAGKKLTSAFVALSFFVMAPYVLLQGGDIQIVPIGGGGSTPAGISQADADTRYVNTAGDTMTHNLLVQGYNRNIVVYHDDNLGSIHHYELLSGNGTSSGRNMYLNHRSYEASTFVWRLGNQGSTDYKLRYHTGSADVWTATTAGVFQINSGPLNLIPITAPSAPASGVYIYLDAADGDLKAKHANGTTGVILAN